MSWDEYPYRVLSSRLATPVIRELVLLPDDAALPYLPGQYALLNDPDYQLPPHDRLRNADPVMLTGPYGTFAPDPDRSGAVLLLAAGSGLAPARALAEALLDEQPSRPVTLFFSSRTIEDAIDHARFQDWAANRQGFRYLLTPTRAPDAPRWPHIPDLLAYAVGELIGWEVFASGPPGFVTGCAAAARALGADPAAVHTEEFFADPQPWTGPPPVAVESGVCP